MACADHCIMVLMAFLSRAFPLRELVIQDLPGHDASMQVGAYGGVMFSLPQHVHDFVRGFKIQDLLEGTLFETFLSLLAIRRSNKLSWAVEGCSGQHHCEFRTGVFRGMTVYW